MNHSKVNHLVKGALILTVAGLMSKVLSAFYRIPLQNLGGDFGFYIYQQIYPFIGTVMILSLYSFPTAISRLSVTIQEKHTGQLSLQSFYVPILIILLGINGLFFLLLFRFSLSFAQLIGDPELETAFKLLAISFLLIPFTSFLRGLFQGYGEMKPTAYSQMIEQLVRVVIIITVSYFVLTREWSVYSIGKAGALATFAGLFSAIVVLFVYFLKHRPYTLQRFSIPWGYYIRVLFLFGLVASLNHMVLLIIQLADVFTLVPALVEFGLDPRDAMQMKSIFDRGQPLIQFGTVIGSSFALALIPAVSNKLSDSNAVYDALVVSFYISAGAMIGLVMLIPEVNVLLFKDLSGTTSLRILVVSILLGSIVITTMSILQSVGYMKRTAFFILLAFGIKWLLNIAIVPMWGIVGSSIATVISLIVLCFISLIELHRKLPRFNILHMIKWRIFGLSSGLMVLYILIIKWFIHVNMFQSRLLLLLYVCFIVGSGAFIYLYLLVRNHAFSVKQLSALPFGQFLIKLKRN